MPSRWNRKTGGLSHLFVDPYQFRVHHACELRQPKQAAWLSGTASRGVILHNHICGNTLPIADDFIATGAAVLEIDHKTDARAIKPKAAGKTTLLGNIDTGLLYSGTPSEVEAACREAIEIMAPGGGFILGPGCALGTDTPAANIHALVESAKKYGRY